MNRRIEELRGQVRQGGLREAAVRVLMYVSQAQGGIDERSYNLIRTLRRIEDHTLTLEQFKHLVREQALVMTVDPVGAIGALPELLRNASADTIREASDFAKRVVSAGGPLNSVGIARLTEVQRIFEEAAQNSTSNLSPSHFKPSASSRKTASATPASAKKAVAAKAAPAAKKAVAAKPSPVKAASAKAATVKAAPVKAAPVKAAPVKAAPVKVAPLKAAPAKAAPVKAAPVKAAPAKAAPAKAAPTKAVAVTTPAVQAVPATEAPATWTSVSARKKAK